MYKPCVTYQMIITNMDVKSFVYFIGIFHVNKIYGDIYCLHRLVMWIKSEVDIIQFSQTLVLEIIQQIGVNRQYFC